MLYVQAYTHERRPHSASSVYPTSPHDLRPMGDLRPETFNSKAELLVFQRERFL